MSKLHLNVIFGRLSGDIAVAYMRAVLKNKQCCILLVSLKQVSAKTKVNLMMVIKIDLRTKGEVPLTRKHVYTKGS